MTNINPVKPNMDYVKKLLKGRKAGAELELSLADANNPEYSESIAKRKTEISQIDKALLVLYPVSDTLICNFELGIENCGFVNKDISNCKKLRRCDMCGN